MQKVTAAILLTLAVATADVVEPFSLYRNASEIGFQLESPQITDFGSWGEPEYCQPGKIVTGFQLKVEPKHSIDDTALNGIRFFCGTPGSEDQRTNITSKVGYFGNWGKIFNCSTYAVGFELQSQEYQGPRTDDIAANNFKLYCADVFLMRVTMITDILTRAPCTLDLKCAHSAKDFVVFRLKLSATRFLVSCMESSYSYIC